MKNIFRRKNLFIFSIFLTIGAFIIWVATLPPKVLKAGEFKGTEAVIYMSSTCGCCRNFATYMAEEGFKVKTEFVDDMNTIKKKYNIPDNLTSCHTTIVNGYIVEGHIPVEAIVKLLTEKPNIRGIAMAGMPSASPGMPGEKFGPFNIYRLTENNLKNDLFISL